MTRTTPRRGGAVKRSEYATMSLPPRYDIRESLRRALARLAVTAARIGEVVR